MEIAVDRSLRHWWVFLIRGLLFIFVGIYMISTPAGSFAALGFLFGLIILLAGLAELFHVVRDRSAFNRGWHLALGIIDIILGIILIGHMTASEVILRIIVGIWFLFRGISLFSFSRLTDNTWVLKAGGILIFVFALLILFNPLFGALTIVLSTAIAFIITGFFNVLLGFRLKKIEG
jgi:uncharacterized membrane protein HdeD (DUF308 family)